MKTLFFTFLLVWLTGCQSKESQNEYTLHQGISTTVFWVGEGSSQDNHYISNVASAWDDSWMSDFGGVDDPNSRDGWYPAAFVPQENPFYFALPYNDFDSNGVKKADIITYIPWAASNNSASKSVCKNRWIKITKNGVTAYAQWEDVGPFGEDNKEYVFGHSAPANTINNNAGLDVSPAVRDYLGLSDIDTTDWQFVDERDVPEGPWKKIVTTSQVNWSDN